MKNIERKEVKRLLFLALATDGFRSEASYNKLCKMFHDNEQGCRDVVDWLASEYEPPKDPLEKLEFTKSYGTNEIIYEYNRDTVITIPIGKSDDKDVYFDCDFLSREEVKALCQVLEELEKNETN